MTSTTRCSRKDIRSDATFFIEPAAPEVPGRGHEVSYGIVSFTHSE